MITDTIPTSITAKALSVTFSNKEKDRRQNCITNIDFYYDAGHKYLDLVNFDVMPMATNVFKTIAKKRASLLYNQKLVREMEGPAQSVNFITDLYEHINIDSFLLAADLAAELTGVGLVHIRKDESGEISLQLFNGKDFSPVTNEYDPDKADALALVRVFDRYDPKTKSVSAVIEQQIWTDDSVTTYEGESEGATLSSTETHDIGFIPFIPFYGEEIDGSYLGHPPMQGIRMLQHALNTNLTNLGYTIKMESFSPIVLKGYESGEGFILNPGKAINLPAGADATTLNFPSKVREVLDVIQWMEDKIFESSGVPKISVTGGESSNSGRELMVKWFPIVQVFNEKATRYTMYEHKLMNAILALAGLPEIPYLKVNYPTSAVLPLSSEEETLDRDIKLNIKTPIDELMRRDPTLTEDEAQAIILSNKVINDSMRSAPKPIGEPEDEVEDEVEVEDEEEVEV